MAPRLAEQYRTRDGKKGFHYINIILRYEDGCDQTAYDQVVKLIRAKVEDSKMTRAKAIPMATEYYHRSWVPAEARIGENHLHQPYRATVVPSAHATRKKHLMNTAIA
jgi:hypothetical protein